MALLPALLLIAPPVKGVAPTNDDEPYRIADAYLKALVGQGDQAARDYMLGGVTFMAQTVTVDNYKIVKRDPVRTDSGELADVIKAIAQIDKAGRKALDKMTNVETGPQGDEGETMGEVTAEQAKKLMAPAQALMGKFYTAHPTFHYIARMDKDVYWHPKNPIRPLLESTPKKGHYKLEVHRFEVESVDNNLNKPKHWPLRILRLQVEPNFDTQWKILPAADWNPEE
jgi:hypothetical protein